MTGTSGNSGSCTGILGTAGTQPTRYLRQFFAPAAYQSTPNELVPMTSYLWFLDSSRAWAMALG